MKTKINVLLMLILIISKISFAQKAERDTIVIKTSAVCGMCKDKIETSLYSEKGIKKVVLDVKTKEATVTFIPAKISAEQIRMNISKCGYDADDIAADKEAYEKLHYCCKKDAH